MNANGLPEGYASARVGGALVIARDWALEVAVRGVERHGSLHAWAASRAGARALAGRGTAWAVDVPPGASAPPATAGAARAQSSGANEPPAAGTAPAQVGASAPPATAGTAPAQGGASAPPAAGTARAQGGASAPAATAGPSRWQRAGANAPPSAGPAPAVANERWVVRHYRRGGAVARWMGDRYLRLGATRPLRELRASAAARARGIRTPEVVALYVHPAGLFYRADLATIEVPGALDLAESLWAEHESASDPGARLAALAAAGRLLRDLAAAGVRHPDLNAKNILIAGADAGAGRAPGAEPVVAWVLDLDGCRVGEPLDWKRRREAQARLERSLRKWERLTRRPLAPTEWAALREALERPAAPRGDLA